MKYLLFFIILVLLSVLNLSAQFSSNIDYTDKPIVDITNQMNYIELIPILNQKNVSWTIALEDSGQGYNADFNVTQFGVELRYLFPVSNLFNMGVSSEISNWNRVSNLYYNSTETGLNDTIIDIDEISFNDYDFTLEFSDIEMNYLAKLNGKLMDYSENNSYNFFSFYGEYSIINELQKKSKKRLLFNLKYVYYDEEFDNKFLNSEVKDFEYFSSFYDFKPIYSIGLKYTEIDDEFTYNLSTNYFAYPDSLYRSSTGLNLEIGIDYKLKESSLKFSIDGGTNIGMDFNDVDYVLYNKAIPSFYYSIGASSFLFSDDLFLTLKWRYSNTPILVSDDIILYYSIDQSVQDLIGDFEDTMIVNNITMSIKYFIR